MKPIVNRALVCCLCCAIAHSTLGQTTQQEPKPEADKPTKDVRATWLIPCLIGVAVIVGGVAIYTVYRSAQCTEKERCPSCGRILPEQKEGEPKLETCPFCLEPLPQDQTNQVHVAFSTGPWTNFTTVIQMSETCGSNWADIVELPNYVFNGGLEIISLPDHAAFEAWLAENGLVANRHIMTTNSLPKGSALFRLVERDRDNP